MRTIENMTSIFGHYQKGRIGARGRPGVSGPPGESGIASMCKWLPKTLLQHFRENEEMFCLMLTDLARDVKIATGDGSQVDSWCSRDSVKHDFTPTRGMKGKLITWTTPDEKEVSAIRFYNSVYQLDGSNLIQTHIKSQSEYSDILFMTFRTTAASCMNAKDERVLLLSRSEGVKSLREIRVDSTGSLFVVDKRSARVITTPIQYRMNVWNTLIVEWYYSEKHSARCVGRAKIVNTTGHPDTPFENFYNIQTPLKDAEGKSSIITLGGCADGTKTFDGDIHCVEYYRVSHNETMYDAGYSCSAGEGGGDGTTVACFGESGMGSFPEKNLFPQPLRSLIKFDIAMSDV